MSRSEVEFVKPRRDSRCTHDPLVTKLLDESRIFVLNKSNSKFTHVRALKMPSNVSEKILDFWKKKVKL